MNNVLNNQNRQLRPQLSPNALRVKVESTAQVIRNAYSYLKSLDEGVTENSPIAYVSNGKRNVSLHCWIILLIEVMKWLILFD